MFHESGFRIGDELPPGETYHVQGRDLPEPVWYVFGTPAMKERNAEAWLNHRGLEVWYPREKAWRHNPRGVRKKVPYMRLIVPRYVFVQFTGEPVWHVVRKCPWLSYVVGTPNGEEPMPISDRVMAQMEQVPQRLEKMRREAEERRRVRPGDRVKVIQGAATGWIVSVTEVHAGIARYIAGPLKGEVPVERVRKLDVA